MFNQNLKKIRIEMLKGGVKPKYVKRTIHELNDHYFDLQSDLLKDGVSENEAETQAAEKIGDLNEIAKEALRKKELQSWISLHPKTIFLLTPVFIYSLALAICLFMLIGVTNLSGEAVSGYPTPLWFQGLSISVVFIYNYLVPVSMVIYFIYIFRERLIRKSIIYLSIVLIALFGSFLLMSISFPDSPGELGSLSVSLTTFGYNPVGLVFHLDRFISQLLNIGITLISARLAWWWFANYSDVEVIK